MRGPSERGLREEADHNQPVGGQFAVCIAAAKENRNSWRNYEFNDSARPYVTAKRRIGQEQQAYYSLWRALWVANGSVPLKTGVGTVATQLAALDAAAFTSFSAGQSGLENRTLQPRRQGVATRVLR